MKCLNASLLVNCEDRYISPLWQKLRLFHVMTLTVTEMRQDKSIFSPWQVKFVNTESKQQQKLVVNIMVLF